MKIRDFAAGGVLARSCSAHRVSSIVSRWGTLLLPGDRNVWRIAACPGTSRALSVAPKNTRFGQQFGFHDDPWPLVIRAAQHRADGYLLMADG